MYGRPDSGNKQEPEWPGKKRGAKNKKGRAAMPAALPVIERGKAPWLQWIAIPSWKRSRARSYDAANEGCSERQIAGQGKAPAHSD